MILVTGASGFIGSYLCEELYRRAFDFVATGRMSVKDYQAGAGERGPLPRRAPNYRWKYVRADLSREADVDRLPQANTIIHTAGLLMIDKHEPCDYFKVNTIGTINLMQHATRTGVARVIFTQTHSDTNRLSRIKHESERRYFYDRDTGKMKDNPIPFIISKLAAEEAINCYAREIGFESITLRFSNIRGVGSRDKAVDSPFWQFIDKARKGEPIELWGEPKTYRDFIYIKDVISAIIAATRARTSGGIFNVGSGEALTVAQEIDAICEVFCPPGRRSPIMPRPDIPEVRKGSSLFDITEAKIALAWEPLYSYVGALYDMKKMMEG